MSKRILMIDDEPDLVKVVHVRLAGEGYEFISADNGLEGVEKATKDNPDLILLDVMMPRMHGLEVLRELKRNADTASIPVVMLTAKDDTEYISEAKELGAKDYLTKPFNPEALVAIVEKHLP